MSATKNYIPKSLEGIYNYLIRQGREEDQQFMLRCIQNKEAGLGLRKYEIERLRDFEEDWFNALPDDAVVVDGVVKTEPIDIEPIKTETEVVEEPPGTSLITLTDK